MIPTMYRRTSRGLAPAPAPALAQLGTLDGLSISKALNWISDHKREVVGGVAVLGGAALAAHTAGGWSALGTKEGWSRIGDALVGAGGKAVSAVKKINVGQTLSTTAKIMSTVAGANKGGAPQGGPQSGAYNIQPMAGQRSVPEATVNVEDDMPEAGGGLPTWLPWAAGGVAVLGLLWMLTRNSSGSVRYAVAA